MGLTFSYEQGTENMNRQPLVWSSEISKFCLRSYQRIASWWLSTCSLMMQWGSWGWSRRSSKGILSRSSTRKRWSRRWWSSGRRTSPWRGGWPALKPELDGTWKLQLPTQWRLYTRMSNDKCQVEEASARLRCVYALFLFPSPFSRARIPCQSTVSTVRNSCCNTHRLHWQCFVGSTFTQ